MEDQKEEATAALDVPSQPAATGDAKKTGKKKKRANPEGSKQRDGKATKKKKKDANSATATVAADVSATNSNNSNKNKKSSPAQLRNIDDLPLVEQVVYRLTEGIPRMELKAMLSEANECEKELQQEIDTLESALKEEIGPLEREKEPGEKSEDPLEDTQVNENNINGNNQDTGDANDNDKAVQDTASGTETLEASKESMPTTQQAVNLLLENPFTPLDKCFTLSALLGRLRDDLAVPSIRKPAQNSVAASSTAPSNKKKKTSNVPAATYAQIVALAGHPNYTRTHPEPPSQLLHIWRKIASHRTAMVFRKPVKPEEAPGYTDRILFPMDLSLVRKMIVARILTSYSEVHQKIRLISHNCVKYNGRESDYGIVAREFEAMVDEYMVAAVQQTPGQAAMAAATSQSTKGGGSGRSSPKSIEGGSGRSSPNNLGGGSGRSTPVPGSGRLTPSMHLGHATNASAPSPAAISAATEAAAAAVTRPATKTHESKKS